MTSIDREATTALLRPALHQAYARVLVDTILKDHAAGATFAELTNMAVRAFDYAERRIEEDSDWAIRQVLESVLLAASPDSVGPSESHEPPTPR